MVTAVDQASAVRRTPWLALIAGGLCAAWTAAVAALQFGVLLWVLLDPKDAFPSQAGVTVIRPSRHLLLLSAGLSGLAAAAALALGISLVIQAARAKTRSCRWLAATSLLLTLAWEVWRQI